MTRVTLICLRKEVKTLWILSGFGASGVQKVGIGTLQFGEIPLCSKEDEEIWAPGKHRSSFSLLPVFLVLAIEPKSSSLPNTRYH